MSRGRTPRKCQSDSRSFLRSAVGAVLGRPPATPVEPLEGRRLLTTLVGGQSFTYFDASEQRVTITLSGSITAEFLAARVPTSNRNGYTANLPVVRDLIPAPPPGTMNPITEGADLYNIYVAEAGDDAAIYISRSNANGVLTPYAGSVGAIRGVNVDLVDDGDGGAGDGGTDDNGTATLNTPDASGGVYIGARTIDVTPGTTLEEMIPITQINNRRMFGVRPATRAIYAGLQTAAGVNLKNVFIGGTITGIVDVEGSVGTFYAGNILTGNTGGLSAGVRTTVTNNFSIAGDLQQMYVNGSVGTNAAGNYRTGVNVRVGGRIGYIHVNGSWSGQITERAASSAPAVNTPMPEGEFRFLPNNAANISANFLNGILAQTVTGNNDAASGANAQFTYSDANGNMSWQGTLQNDPRLADALDNYSLPLMAGQSAVIQLNTGITDLLTGKFTSTPGLANVGVFDPLGRLIATDLAGPTGAAGGQQFQITATVPGVYRLAVASLGDSQFTGAGTTLSIVPYILTASGVGTVNVGGVQVGNRMRFLEPGNGIALRTGDLGGVYALGEISAATTAYNGVASPINLSRGNLRALYGSAVGVEVAARFGMLDLVIPRGSVGYIRANGSPANNGGTVAIMPSALDANGDPLASAAIGGDIQRVEATGDVDSALVANGRIGTIIAGGINSNTIEYFVPIISANTDQRGSDGTVDMIYVNGDVGTGAFPGPGLYNGLDGNIKYFFVTGQVYRDQFFGNAIQAETSLQPGRAINFVDDSGARAVIRPTDTLTTAAAPAGSLPGTLTDPLTGATTTVALDPTTGALTSTVSTPGALTYTSYGVRGVGGQVMINLTSSSSFSVTGQTTSGQIDISNAVTNGTGSAPQVVDLSTIGTGTPPDAVPLPPNGNPGVSTTVGYPTTTTPTGGTATTTVGTVAPIPNEINFYGRTPVNAFHLTGNNLTSVINFTNGEIASVDATSIGMIIGQTVGQTRDSGAGAVVVPGNMNAATPFNGFSRGINATGPIISVLGRDGVGNVSSGSTINTINPNVDGKNARGINDGINGAIQADVLNVVNIGEGIGFGGSGTVVGAGVFAESTLNNLVGIDADIRGPVVSGGVINSISLTNGSIINTRVGTLTGTPASAAFAQGLFTAGGLLLTDPASNNGFALNRLQIIGDGGVIGSDLVFGNFAAIDIGGFGLIGSRVASTAAGNVNGTLTVAGFGIRSSRIDVGSSIRTVSATGKGRVLNTTDFNSRVTQTGGTRRRRYDAFSGRLLSGTNDLNRFFGTSRTRPGISGATNAGVIADTQFTGLNTLGTLNAYAISTANTSISINSQLFPNRISFASGVGAINIDNSISGLQLRTGQIDSLTVGNLIQRASIAVAGEIGSINVGRTIRGSTSISAQNANGSIGSITVRGGLYGTVVSQGQIGTIGAGTIGANITSNSGITRIGVTGDVLTGTTIYARRNIDRVVIGGDFENDATINAADIGVFRVGGANDGDVVNR